MKTDFSHNPKSRRDLDRISGKNLLENELVRPTNKFVKLVTKTNDKVQELKT